MNRRTSAALALAIAATLSSSLQAVPPVAPTAVFGLVAHTSSPKGIVPTHNPGETFYKYTYTVPQNSSLTDSITIDVCLDAASNGDAEGWSDDVSTDAPAGAFSSYISVGTPPWSFNSTSTVIGECRQATISINVPASATSTVGGYQTNIKFRLENGTPSTGPLKLKDGWDTERDIHIFVNVTAAQTLTQIFCYLTDSLGFFLQDCAGNAVNASDDHDSGRFAIVANKSKKGSVEVATNPGQFYYNLLWVNNTGVDQTVSASFVKSHLGASGAQALHWLTFVTNPDQNPTTGLTGFSDVIEANPAGSTGPVDNIVVPAGQTLYITYHLDYLGLGSPVPSGCAANCPDANQPISVSAIVSGSFGTDVCASGALGYLKQ